MLTEANGEFSVELFRQILDPPIRKAIIRPVFQCLRPQSRIMYLYLFHDFEHVVEIHLAEELALGIHEYNIPSLFFRKFGTGRF